MINKRDLHLTRTERIQNNAVFNLIEFGYLMYLLYSTFGQALNIDFQNVGAIWLAILAAVCLPLVNWRGMQLKLILFVIAIAGSHVLIQIFFYGQTLETIYVITYFWWIFLIIVISTLLQRPDFFKRVVVCMFIFALIWSPFVKTYTVAGVDRVELNAISSLSNSNDYAESLGFCAMFLWLWSLQKVSRNASFARRSGAVVAIILALRAVSRGFLITVGSAFLLSLRKLKAFRAILVLIIVGGVGAYLVNQVPFFHQILSAYQMRFVEPTSRINVLPISLHAIASNPIVGYGVQNLRNILPITPHNELLLLWISSGILPAALFIAFVIYFFILAIRNQNYDQYIDPLPIIIFVIFNIPLTNTVLPRLWAVLGVSYVFAISDLIKTGQKTAQSARQIPDIFPLKDPNAVQDGTFSKTN
jgi:hypothetical protein